MSNLGPAYLVDQDTYVVRAFFIPNQRSCILRTPWGGLSNLAFLSTHDCCLEKLLPKIPVHNIDSNCWSENAGRGVNSFQYGHWYCQIQTLLLHSTSFIKFLQSFEEPKLTMAWLERQMTYHTFWHQKNHKNNIIYIYTYECIYSIQYINSTREWNQIMCVKQYVWLL